MSAVLAFVGTYLLSLLVALLAALQLADYFLATEEFVVMLTALPAFVTLAMAAFIAANRVARRVRVFNGVALGLALAALAPLALPAFESVPTAIEFVVPALFAILVQWGLTRRHWLRRSGLEDLSLWPWVTTAAAGLAVLNPIGLEVVGAALRYAASDWLRDLWRNIALAGAAALIAMAAIEYYIRSRMLRRRLGTS